MEPLGQALVSDFRVADSRMDFAFLDQAQNASEQTDRCVVHERMPLANRGVTLVYDNLVDKIEKIDWAMHPMHSFYTTPLSQHEC